jgi:WD40 repeat protein
MALPQRRRYEKPRDLLPHEVAVLRVAYSPDGRYLASGCLDGSVTVWDRRTGQRLPSWKGGPEAQHAHIYGLAFSPDSRYLAAGGNDRRILVWDLDARTLWHGFEGHKQTITQLAFHPDGRHLASASEDGTYGSGTCRPQEGLTFREHQEAVRAWLSAEAAISAGATEASGLGSGHGGGGHVPWTPAGLGPGVSPGQPPGPGELGRQRGTVDALS